MRILLVLLTSLLLSSQPPSPASARHGWPLRPRPAIGARFAPGAERWSPGHRGVDLVTVSGSAVLASGAGRVVYAGRLVDRGVVSVEHPDGRRTTYEPLSPTVRRGDQVARGQVIGRLEPGHAGCAGAACLHWGLRVGEGYRNPLGLLSPRPVLLPPR